MRRIREIPVSAYVRRLKGKRIPVSAHIRRIDRRWAAAGAVGLGAAAVGYKYRRQIKVRASEAGRRAREKAAGLREKVPRKHLKKIAAAAIGTAGLYVLWRDIHGRKLIKKAGLSQSEIRLLKSNRTLRKAVKKRARRYKRKGYNSDTALIKALQDYRALVARSKKSPSEIRRVAEAIERSGLTSKRLKMFMREHQKEIYRRAGRF